WVAVACASSASTRSTIWLARDLSVGLRSRGSVAGLNWRTTTLAGFGCRDVPCRCRSWVSDKTFSLGSMWGSGAQFPDVPRGHTLTIRACELPHLRKREKVGHGRFTASVFVRAVRM